MRLPIYKKVLIAFPQKKQIENQLDQIDFGENPYIFELSKQVKEHLACFKIIENYLEEHDINTHSYPIYILSDVIFESKRIHIAKSIEQVPKFFNHRSKQLSSKESGQLELIHLKQIQLDNLQKENFAPALESFAQQAKIIFQLQREKEFYQKIYQRIEE